MKKVSSKSMAPALTCFVAGLVYSDIDVARVAGSVRKGQLVKLVWESDNKYDPFAIKLTIGGRKLGYIPREETHVLHQLRERRAGFRAFVKTVAPTNPTHRMVLIEVLVHGMEGTADFRNV